jgi:hypothetical protein
MLHNDHQYDRLFRDRLRDHSSPVRADLWRRIYNGLGSRPAFRFSFRAAFQSPLRYWPFLAAGTAAAATIAIAVTHFIHNPAPRSHPSANSTATVTPSAVTPATVPIATVTPPSPATVAPPSPAIPRSVAANPSPSTQPVNHYLTISPTRSGNNHSIYVTHRRSNRTHNNPAPLTLRSHSLRPPTLTAANSPQLNKARQPTSLDPNSANTSGATPANHHPNPVTLPAIASTSTRAAVTARPLILRSRHNDPGNPNPPPDAPRPIKTGYASLYGSADFPGNHYYTWSYTAGGALTIQFSRHWSGTAGLEYGRVNVPTQVVPPVGPFDTLYAFHFSNYEVPVLIGYTRMLGDYALTVSGGAILNIHSHQSNSPGNLVTSATSTWVFNWPNRDSYGAYLGADIFHPLGHNLHLFAQPYARYSISNYRMFIPVQRLSYGVLLGVRYLL